MLLILTDGEPSDCTFDELKLAVATKISNVYVTFVMCTNEDAVVSKYNRWLDRLPGVDICDDYLSEKREVVRARPCRRAPRFCGFAQERRGRSLTYFKWLCKAVLGSKLPKYDKLDEASCGRCVCSVQ